MMDTSQLLEQVVQITTPWGKSFTAPEPNRLDVVVEAADLPAAAAALSAARWGYLAAITGLDCGAQDGRIEALYHFCAGAAVAALRVTTPRAGASLPSICAAFPSASIFERELSEMLGVTFVGAPDVTPLFLPEDWSPDIFPLRKDTDLSQPTTVPVRPPPTNGENGRHFIVPIGPQHPALKEPGHFEFSVAGETVIGATVRLGYAHRGIEKAVEQRNWVQDLYLLERICGICSHIHATAYCLGVEKLAEVTAPPRAETIRTLFAELERLHSHMLWLGVAAHEAGFDTLFMAAWRDRETVMDLLEQISGNRVHYSVNVLGGVKFDLEPQHIEALLNGVNFTEERARYYLDLVNHDPLFNRRTRGVGVMTAEQAEKIGVVGPTARGSGIVRDVRVEAPYLAYTRCPVEAIVEPAGDLAARFSVRIRELLESCRLIRVLLETLPEGELQARMPRRIRAGEAISRVEAPRGELIYFVKSSGGETPERIRVRTPTLCNLASALTLSIGRPLADIPMILVGVDPCFSCNDRTTTIHAADGSADDQTWTWEQLRRYGIEAYR